MLVRRRIALLAASGGLVAAVAALGTPTPADAVRPTPVRHAPVRVQVEGTLLVAQPDGPGARPAYAVALADGDLVPVTGPLAHVRPLSHFSGRLALPASVSDGLAGRAAIRPGATLDESSTLGRAALRLVDRRSQTLRVVGTPSLTAPHRAASPTSHQQYVAALDNEGSLGQDDTQLLAHVTTVGSYWEHEANGAISGIGVPATVTHYDTALSTTDCGLGSDFFSVVQEAAQQFPGLNPFTGSSQLVLFVPAGCSSGGVVGEGTVGSSFASGGALVVKAGTAIEGTYAHETGHNYGFAHSNARWGTTSMEYFGVYDVMGFALGGGVNQLTALSTPFRVFEGITDPGEIQKVDLGDGKAPVRVHATIAPRSDDTGVRSVRVVDPDTGEPLYLDYRSGTGQDAGAFYGPGRALSSSKGTVHYAQGVTISAARESSGVDTLVLDSAGDTALAAGTAWHNASGSLRVVVTSTAPTGAEVTVRYRPQLARLASTLPTIEGHPRIGKRLTAVPGAWTHGTTFHYQWFAGSRAIKHATTKRLVLTRAQRGERIRVRVTGTKPGYHARSRTSSRTSKVT